MLDYLPIKSEKMDYENVDRVTVSPESFLRLRSLLRENSNIDTSIYKKAYIERRLMVRMRTTEHPTSEGYLDHVENSPDEYKKLQQVLTVNVTRFFRNSQTFDKLKDLVIPQIVRDREERKEKKINVLSVGCSTGEESYSVAILFLEEFLNTGVEFDLRVIGTDIDKKALFFALKGIYSKAKISEIPKDFRDKYFFPTPEGFKVSPVLRETVIFLRKDIFSDSAYRRFDLILARNILIYFMRSSQEVLMEKFYRQLMPWGFLVLGRTESLVGQGRQFFKTISIADRIYRRA